MVLGLLSGFGGSESVGDVQRLTVVAWRHRCRKGCAVPVPVPVVYEGDAAARAESMMQASLVAEFVDVYCC